MVIIAIDPGSDKCGVCVWANGQPKLLEVVPKGALTTRLQALIGEFAEAKLIMGDGTNSQQVLAQLASLNLDITSVDETNTTLIARSLYWQYNKPSFWQSLLPQDWRSIDTPLDAYAALAIVQRYLQFNK